MNAPSARGGVTSQPLPAPMPIAPQGYEPPAQGGYDRGNMRAAPTYAPQPAPSPNYAPSYALAARDAAAPLGVRQAAGFGRL
jgi:hypothetical protein